MIWKIALGIALGCFIVAITPSVLAGLGLLLLKIIDRDSPKPKHLP